MSECVEQITRKQLVELARDNPVPGVKELLAAIDEANIQLKFAVTKLSSRVGTASQHAVEDNYEVAGSFVKDANDYEIAAAKLNTLMLTLSCVLQNAGVKHEY
jgi:phosphoglycolate phosphatase-like HAD superfamily hydrolase